MKRTTFFVLSGVTLIGLLGPASCGGNAEVNDEDGFSGRGGSSGSGGSSGTGGTGGTGIIIPDAGGGTGGTGGGDGGCTNCVDAGVPVCGDGKRDFTEVCDDGNGASGDGCAANCEAIEQNYQCPVPGEPCVNTVRCGDGVVSGNEQCDDRGTAANDGCSATCTVEAGWSCPVAGSKCTTICGDGVVRGKEECDFKPARTGCTATCRVTPGYVCNATACTPTVCNDGRKEGVEACDDGNNRVGDGCTPLCQVEPLCGVTKTTNECRSRCGDGMTLPSDNEACDDGNTRSGDGCSATCVIEAGYACTQTTQTPNPLVLPIVYRDFISHPRAGFTRHPDFQIFDGSQRTPGLVQTQLDATNKLPVYTGICSASDPDDPPCPYGQQMTTAANFNQWYRDTPNVNVTVFSELRLARQANGSYIFDSQNESSGYLFPLDNRGWVAGATPRENRAEGRDEADHNFGFTSELRYYFEYRGGEQLDFDGDDDVWVFVGGQLALDLGGLHPRREGTFTITPALATTLGLEVGRVYEIALFHAERKTDQSNFKLTLRGFNPQRSVCDTRCGDKVVAGDEECDDGVNNGSYGTCTAQCKRAPYCGNARKDGPEYCDNGVNISVYSTDANACAPGCKRPAFCGDAKVDSLFGEQCDLGTDKNVGGYQGCNANCTLSATCGDGKLDPGESCDDGNRRSGDGCSGSCRREAVPE